MEECQSKAVHPDTKMWAVVIVLLCLAGLVAAVYCYHDGESRVRSCIAKSVRPEECHDK